MLKCPHCENEFEPESSEELGVYNAKTRILTAKCPSCTKNFRLNREESDRLIDKFPELADEMQQMKVEKSLKNTEPEELPANDFEGKFRDALSIFGLNSKKYETKIQAVLKLTERTGATRDWLKYHMQRFGLTNRQTIDSIVDIVFLDEADQNNMPPYPMPGASAGGGYPGSGYTAQTLPGGQVILVPTAPQAAYPQSNQPIIINPGGDRGDRTVKVDHDEQVVIEELDGEGKVKKRIIKGGGRHSSDEGSEDQTMKTLTMLRELGILKPVGREPERQTATIPDEVRETLDSLGQAIAALSASITDKPSKPENEDLKKMSSTIDQLNEKLMNYEKEKRDNETKAMRDEIAEMKGMIRDLEPGKHHSDTPEGLTDGQFETHTKHKSLQTITESGEHLVNKITDPLNKIMEGQQKLSAMVTVREMERTDGVPPGTYMKVLQPMAAPTDAQVSATVRSWQDKAANTPVAKKAGAAT